MGGVRQGGGVLVLGLFLRFCLLFGRRRYEVDGLVSWSAEALHGCNPRVSVFSPAGGTLSSFGRVCGSFLRTAGGVFLVLGFQICKFFFHLCHGLLVNYSGEMGDGG